MNVLDAEKLLRIGCDMMITIYEHFKYYNKKYYELKDKLVDLKEAEKNFLTLTGNKISDVPKITSNKNFDFGDQLSRIESLNCSYKKIEKEYLEMREQHAHEIAQIENAKYKTILKLFFLENKNIKSVSVILNKIYKLDYSLDYIRKIKTQAVKEFEKVILFHKK